MSKDQGHRKSGDGMMQSGGGLKRRDLLLSGSSLLAASALSGAGFATQARAQLEKGCARVFCFAVHELLGRPPDFGSGNASSNLVLATT